MKRVKSANINEFVNLLNNAEPKTGTFGGRYFKVKGYKAASLNEIVKKAISLSDKIKQHPDATLGQRIYDKIQELDSTHPQSSPCIGILTFVKKIFGKITFNRRKALTQFLNETKTSNVIEASKGLNQRALGNINACTHYAVKFLEKSIEEDYTIHDLDELLCGDIGFLDEMNGYAIDKINASKKLKYVDINGKGVKDLNGFVIARKQKSESDDFSHGFYDVEEFSVPRTFYDPEEDEEEDFYTMHECLERGLEQIIRSQAIHGFVLTTGTESFGIRLREEHVEFFDSHGDVDQRKPASIRLFSKSQAAQEVSHIICERAGILMEECGQVSFFPIVQQLKV